jgi:hypothetical protein
MNAWSQQCGQPGPTTPKHPSALIVGIALRLFRAASPNERLLNGAQVTLVQIWQHSLTKGFRTSAIPPFVHVALYV